MVEKAEQLLLDYGFHQVRVRIHGHLQELRSCRRNFRNFWKKMSERILQRKFKEYGFTYVTMDILGYRMGSMNETLGEK